MNDTENLNGSGLPPKQPPQEDPGSYGAGIAGAFLGALVGILPILIIGMLGFISGWLGFFTAFASMMGYRLLNGRRQTGFAFAVITTCSVVLTTIASVWLFFVYLILAGSDNVQFLVFLLLPIVFSVLGSLAFKNRLKAYTQPELLRQALARAKEENTANAAQPRALYCPAKGWMRRLRASLMVSMFSALVLTFVLVFLGSASGNQFTFVFAGLGALAATFLIIFSLLPLTKLLRCEEWVFARTEDGTLWRIHVARLNNLDAYRFTVKSGALVILNWRRLSPEEQEMATASIFRAISDLEGGRLFPGSALSTAVVPLRELVLRKENKWSWKLLYRADNGRLKKLEIAKAYPELRPVYETEAPQGPAPFRLGLCLIALALALGLAAVGGFGGYLLDGGAPLPALGFGSSKTREPVTARIPDSADTYQLNGVSYQLDSTFVQRGGNTYLDSTTGAEFTVSVQRDMDESGATQVMLALIGTARYDTHYDSFQFDQLADNSANLAELAAANGEIYQYNILTVYFTNGKTEHMGVALMDGGALIAVGAKHDSRKDEDKVKADLLYILESAQARITEGNYQTLFLPADSEGYSYIGIAFFKAPEEMFGYGAFLDAYLPYGGTLEHSDDGYTVQSTAHGISVCQTIRAGKNAEAVVDQAYQELAESGAVDLYTDGVYDTQYYDDYDIACKQITYFEGDGTKPRIAYLYADAKENGYYLFAQITYLPELFDEEYPALVPEVGDVFALNLPELPAF